ncbi:DNA-processing protein DprA [Variovorax sp. V213]|uniref:DNA-processing protein DprA n=1 Tax=Variovorax sp. V213 TaxID=3065955 RepID=UPI0034E8692F
MNIHVANFLHGKPVDAGLEMGAYEHLWLQPDATVKRIAELFQRQPDALPSDLVGEAEALSAAREVLAEFEKKGLRDVGVRVHGAHEYPEPLRDAADPIDVLYYRGAWELAESPKRIAVVGTRAVTPEGINRTKRLVKLLVENGFTIVSGLAKGVDTVAHRTAIDSGGETIAVIGTPISQVYPRENEKLQEEIARRFLLVSQVPVLRYARQDYRWNRGFFPERNKTMSALTQGTVIVEAAETSGTLIQAKAALEQGRKLFILDNNFRNPDIRWPARLESQGAIRVREFSDLVGAFE